MSTKRLVNQTNKEKGNHISNTPGDSEKWQLSQEESTKRQSHSIVVAAQVIGLAIVVVVEV